jgi:hypothetical protein
VGKRPLVIVLVVAIAAFAGVVIWGFAVGSYQEFGRRVKADVGYAQETGAIADSLRKLPGVTSVDTAFNAFAGRDPAVTITVTTQSSITPAGLAKVVSTTSAGAVAKKLPIDVLTLSVGLPDGSTLDDSATRMPESTSATAIAVWSELRSSTGAPLVLRVTPSIDGYTDADYAIDINPKTPQATTLARLVAGYPDALPSIATPRTVWALPAMTSTGGFPSKPALELLQAASAVSPVSGRAGQGLATTGANLIWSTDYPAVNSIGAFYPKSQAKDQLARVDRLTAVVAATPIAVRRFNFEEIVNNADKQYDLYLGTCSKVVNVTKDDTDYVRHLAAAGIELPEGSGPGICDPAQ